MSNCPHLGFHTDAAKRLSDAVTLHWEAIGYDSVGKWVAYKLADGTADPALYPSKRDAVRHQSNELLCGYIRLHPAGMTVCEAEIMIQVTRKAHDRGYRFTDPDAKHGGRDLILPITREGIYQQMRALTGKRKG